MKKILNYFFIFVILTITSVILISSLINIYKHRTDIAAFFYGKDETAKQKLVSVIDQGALDSTWANNIKKGGYVLWFRHAHRNKWDESVAYLDAYALKNNIDEAKSSFSDGTCLSQRGVQGAKILGKIMLENQIKISEIWSSPSCRSKETAMIAFGRIDKIYNCILHGSAININQHKACALRMKNLVLNHKLKNNQNLVISGHGNTLNYFGKNFYSHKISKDIINLEEGSFFVLKKNLNNNIDIVYKFSPFADFSNALSKIEIN